ncbi:MAG TPA: metallophosphoesterase [Victivallales bacterium]|nr:metallophosphoesterase [Victivallales bacterium]
MKPIHSNRKIRESQNKISFITKDSTKKFHLFSLKIVIITVKFIFRICGVMKIMRREAYDLQLAEHTLFFQNLPQKFNDLKILFLSDIHIDLVDNIKGKLLKTVNESEFDICILGGDYVYKHKKISSGDIREFYRKLIEIIQNKSRKIYGILGNHDRYESGVFLESLGVKILVNESVKIEKDNEFIYISGIDDPCYFGAHDFDLCEKDIIDSDCFKILISHSPGTYKDADKLNYSLSLNGHTHGGQICLPGGNMIFSNTSAPNKLAKGCWKYNNLQGYTSNGIGCSGFAGRLYCKPEVVILKLKCAN